MSETNSSRLTPIGPGRNYRFVLYRCVCGTEKEISKYDVARGFTKSCGCLNREVSAQHGRANRKHGLSASPEYSVWAGMKQRCRRDGAKKSKYYGEKGITVCKRWKGKNGFQNFFADMGSRPGPEYSIDRIKTAGNYEPGNCRWTTIEVQNRNKTQTRLITYDGKTLCVAEWARHVGIAVSSMWSRIERWGEQRAVSTPKRRSPYSV